MGAPVRNDEDSTSFFEAVRASEKDATKLAGRWAGMYAKNEDKALSQLLSFLFQSCGAANFLEPDDIGDDVDVDDVVQDMVTAAMEGKVEDTLGSKLKGMKNFKQNLLTFWDSLVLECQSSYLYDDKLLNRVSSFVIALASSSPRIYRHVATITALQLVSSLVSVGNSLTESRQTFERQLGVEQSKNSKGTKVATLQKNIDDVVDKTASIEVLMRNLITGVFMHRYRDTDPDIRLACISFLGSWIYTYPSYYLTDQYLKYIGWMLNDKISSVRLASISALVTLYENPDFIPALSLFTERFLQRLIQLAEDVDVNVAVQALSLQKLLLGKELIGEEDVAPLYDLLFDDNTQIRHAIGTIVYEQRIAQANDSPSSRSSKASKTKKGSETQISNILRLLVDKSDTSAAAYVVDALWESTLAMQDWKTVCKMLLAEQSKEELSHEDTVNLAFILSASVKRSVQVSIVSTAEAKRTNPSKAQKNLVEAKRQELTTALMKPLPDLLRKYLPDADIVQHLVDIIPYLDLELFSIKRRESSFGATINLLKDAFFKHGKAVILQKCVHALSFCAKEGHAELKDVAQHVLSETGLEVVTKLQSSITQVPPEDDEDYSLIVDMRRFCQYQLVAEAGTDELFQGLCGLLDDLSSLNDESIWLALFNLFLQLNWSYAALDAQNPGTNELSALVVKRAKLMDCLEICMEDMLCADITTTSRRNLAAQLVEMIADCWSLFSQEKLRGGKFEALGYEPSDLQIKQFWKLCEELLVLPEEDDAEGSDSKSLHGHESTAVAAAKLVVHKLVPQDYLAPEMVSHFVLHDKAVADVVKRLCTTLKERSSPDEQADLYLNALKKAYERHLAEISEDDHDDLSKRESYVACRELASRLSVMYAAGKGGNRSGIVKLVNAGVEYAFEDAPKQISFLEVGVIQFVQKLGSEEARKVLAEVEVKVDDGEVDQDPSAWRSFVSFTEQLRERFARGEADPTGKSEAARSMPPPKPRGRPRKTPLSAAQTKKLFTAEEEGEEEEDEEEDEISEDEEEAHPPSRRHRAPPDPRPSQESQRQTRQSRQRQTQGYENTTTPTPTPTPTPNATPAPARATAGAGTVTYSRKRRFGASPDAPGAAIMIPESLASQQGSQSQSQSQSEAGGFEPYTGGSGDGDGDVGGTEELYFGKGTATEEQLPGRPAEKRQRFQPLFDSENEDELSPSGTPDEEDELMTIRVNK